MSPSGDIVLRVELDAEGVARASFDGEVISLTAPQLGRLLTELLKALQGPESDDYEREVGLN